MTAPLIRARGLTKTYDSGKQQVIALDHIDVDIYPGAVTIILGPSGSGKSTFLNIVGGMDHPSQGSILCGSVAVHELSDSELTAYRRTQIGFVFQTYNLIPTLTAAENVGIGSTRPKAERHLGGGSVAREPMEPREALTQVGLGDRADAFPYELSGGQMQRVAIARALAKRPALLLCDEPTGALDSATGESVMSALVATVRETGTAAVIVTHNPEFEALADQVIHLRDGHVIEVSSRADNDDDQWDEGPAGWAGDAAVPTDSVPPWDDSASQQREGAAQPGEDGYPWGEHTASLGSVSAVVREDSRHTDNTTAQEPGEAGQGGSPSAAPAGIDAPREEPLPLSLRAAMIRERFHAEAAQRSPGDARPAARTRRSVTEPLTQQRN
ncbi:MAG: ABC transporter ATP-binding protein [Propionibacteriaceae bacterium]|nr:ABC transporter ATP-binding protein [Propionibacteriaceae bacterium]